MFTIKLMSNVKWKHLQRLAKCDSCGGLRQFTKMADEVISSLDATQVKLLEEQCILVDNDDQKRGFASKKTCHLLENINQGMLHRAFSVFLFNQQGELLLQQRADAKITFPSHWTNTCCSHPLNIPGELEEEGSIGVLRAAQRKLKHELGIEPEQVPLDAFHYLTRIHYKSENVPNDGCWGEHEIDYILFIKRDVKLVPNENEVKAHKYVNQTQLNSLMDESKNGSILVTPWFRLVVENFLPKWWSHLDDLTVVKDHKVIHRMIKD